ncbi:helix-turn-helix domain-containing protein [Vibrio crassostreae]|uniref:helix-turn-helix domain-containing protein n=1 Tax=Vibrio crassostreae TaxID=246167 RepID=UPI002E18C7BD|nr:helix-turn-helix domain-containing protein [Vibrio crassostreae]
MAKPPKTILPNGSEGMANTCDVTALPGIIQSAGLVNFNVECNNGELTVTGTNQNGQQIRINSYDANGFTEGTLSTFQPSSIEARRNEAARLREAGHTQQQIATRLGVSQKTISNDLK